MGYEIEEDGTTKSLIITGSILSISSDNTQRKYDLSFAQSITISNQSVDQILIAFPIIGFLCIGLGSLFYTSDVTVVDLNMIGLVLIVGGVLALVTTLYEYVTLPDKKRVTIHFVDGSDIEFLLTEGNPENLKSVFRETALTTSSFEDDTPEHTESEAETENENN